MHDPGLVLGIGNASRGDDGLGWALLDALAGENRADIRLEYRYQLAPEDAEQISRHAWVLFIDAYADSLPGGFSLSPCTPDPAPGLYTHQLNPGAILALCQALYASQPPACCLLVQGYDWALGAGISTMARLHLKRAIVAARSFIGQPGLQTGALPDMIKTGTPTTR